MQVLCLSEEKKIKKERKEKKRKKWQIIFKISSKTDNFLWYNSFESESMTIGSRVRYELVIINLLLLCFGWMRMNLLVNFTQYTKVVRLVFGYNPLRNSSGRNSDFFFFLGPKRTLSKHARDCRCWHVGSVHVLSRLRGTQKMTRVMWKISCSSVKETVYSGDSPRFLFDKEGKMTRPLGSSRYMRVGTLQICSDESYPIYII